MAGGLVVVVFVDLLDGVVGEVGFGLAVHEEIVVFVVGVGHEILLLRAVHVPHVVRQRDSLEKGRRATLFQLH